MEATSNYSEEEKELCKEKIKKMLELYTLFQNGRHFSILMFTCKLALVASFFNSKFKGIFSFKRGNKGEFASEQKNTKMAAILEYGVYFEKQGLSSLEKNRRILLYQHKHRNEGNYNTNKSF